MESLTYLSNLLASVNEIYSLHEYVDANTVNFELFIHKFIGLIDTLNNFIIDGSINDKYPILFSINEPLSRMEGIVQEIKYTKGIDGPVLKEKSVITMLVGTRLNELMSELERCFAAVGAVADTSRDPSSLSEIYEQREMVDGGVPASFIEAASSGNASYDASSVEAATNDWSNFDSASTSRETMSVFQPKKANRSKPTVPKELSSEPSHAPFAKPCEDKTPLGQWFLASDGTLKRKPVGALVPPQPFKASFKARSNPEACRVYEGDEVSTAQCIEGVVYCTCFSQDGSLFAVGSTSSVSIYDYASRECIQHYDSITSNVLSLCFTSDGDRLAVGLRNGVCMMAVHCLQRLWSLASVEPVLCITCSPDDNHVIAATGFAEYIEVESSTGKLTRTVAAPARNGICFAAAGKTLLVAGRHKLTVLDGQTHAVRFSQTCPDISHLCVSPDGRRLVTGLSKPSMSSSGTIGNGLGCVQVWNLADNGRSYVLTTTIKDRLTTISSLVYSEYGEYFACACDKTVIMWSAVTLQCSSVLVSSNWVGSCVLDVRDRIRSIDIAEKKLRSW